MLSPTCVSWKILGLQFLIGALHYTTTYAASLNGTATQTNSSTPKLVFAHFVAGLTKNYTDTVWIDQMKLAASHDIDAFALNVGLPESWQFDQVQTAYKVATQITTASGSPFKLFLSLDMSVIQSAQDVTKWVTTLCPLPAQLLINSRPLISTFSGEANMLGGQNLSAGWNAALKAPLAALNPPLNPLFIPVWSGLDPATAVSNNPVVDGIMTWLSWPSGGETINTNVDIAFQKDSKASQKLYMAGVSPCFFTHYTDKNFIMKSDDNLYITRWRELIEMPIQPDFIEIISWNDYGESHFIGPVAGIPPDGTTWINGFDHSGWLKMSDYFIKWYKTGSPPTVEEDIVYFNYRPHSITATASSDPLPQPLNASFSVDAVYAAGFFTPSSTARTIQISVGGNQLSFGNFSSSGYSTFTAPWSGNGGDVQVSVLDGSGKQLMSKKGSKPINNEIKTYNYNYAVETVCKSCAKSPAPSLRPTSLAFALPFNIYTMDKIFINTPALIFILSTIFTLTL
ncbi:hypothetical protein CROQUDRAFT_656633 [Cronartium quercuum f. sp. fusiforme G11]|uniref:Glycoside hydrolase family 71 protein n=1 Tax=Cronartium quercuum f. sp. fusiforme G11 TaxID=708437 RepID=A0A9P6NMY0_9BASI|nr:hypothetical protein CROQUDRAFT_656633 [Cronartium quercuum f. sp. fusiforme G11]